MILDLEPINLPSTTNIWRCNFATTYFMEIYKGARGKNVKIYESSYFVDEKVIRLEKIRFTEQELNNGEHDATIEIKFMMRNHYKMENQEICYVETTLTSLKEFSG